MSIFQKYKNQYFVETGTFIGYGVQQAVKAGFPNIISIELDINLAQKAQQFFASNKNIKIIQGDAIYMLWDIIKTIQEPITFWLDGHYSGGITAKGDVPDPILQELQIINKHPIKIHNILIDDIRLYKGEVSIKLIEIQDLLKQINKEYKYKLEDGIVKEDILVAYL
jgi:hypothetical protein